MNCAQICLGPAESCIVFYYGTNDDSPEKQYLIDDVSGTIQIYFSSNDTNNGEIKQMALSQDGMKLTCKVLRDGYGPIDFVLSRA